MRSEKATVTQRVLCFGASIAYGSWDPEGGWVDRLKRDLHMLSAGKDEDARAQLLNLGVGGDTSAMVLKRATSETEARAPEGYEPIFILSVGANDARADSPTGQPRISLASYRQNIEKIVQLFLRYSSQVLLIGFTAVDEKAIVQRGVFHTNERLKQFDTALTEIARDHDVTKVDLLDKMLKEDYAHWLVDGLHPDEHGHAWVHDQVKPHVLKALREAA